jgi:glucan phosphoethanolaminetransferase (alkaline phosphatase superfamily)
MPADSMLRSAVPAPWMVALVALLGLSIYLWRALPEYRALAKLPPASPKAPNVLLIVLDTVRAQSLSLYGYHRATTPQLKRKATG